MFHSGGGRHSRTDLWRQVQNEQLACLYCDVEKSIACFFRDDRKTSNIESLKVDWATREVTSLGKSACDRDKDFLVERSPKTYLKNVKCPMLILQERNDQECLKLSLRK